MIYGIGVDVLEAERITRTLERFGARGPGISVYFRDPDGSLMEFMSYASMRK